MPQTDNLSTFVPTEYRGYRLDKALAKLFPHHSRNRLQQWIQEQRVWVDGEWVKQKYTLSGGEWIEIDAVIVAEAESQPEKMPLEIIFEDNALIVINKPAGLVVHPGAGNHSGTLLNGLLWHCKALAELPRAGIVHRLDKETSGLLVVAKTVAAQQSLVSQLQERSVMREYIALVNGAMVAGGTIDEPIGRHPVERKRMLVLPSGREAITHYRVTERFPDHTLLTVHLETGRTHQIRVHMAHIRHSIFADPVYGQRIRYPANCSAEGQQIIASFRRQALHAFRLAFMHPQTQQSVSWESPIPEDFSKLIGVFREVTKHG